MLNRKPDVAVGKSSCSQTTNGGSSGREVPDGRWRETKIMAKIGFIGMGNIGYAIMRSLLNKYKTEDITFTDLNRRRVAQIEKETGVKAVDTNQDCTENAKYIVLAIKPQFYDNVLADIKDHVTKENIIISIAPGITIDSVNEKLGGDRRIVRAMPNTPALIGEGMTGVCYDKKLFEETEKQMISNFFESFGMMEIVPEYMMNAVVCISSSAPAYICSSRRWQMRALSTACREMWLTGWRRRALSAVRRWYSRPASIRARSKMMSARRAARRSMRSASWRSMVCGMRLSRHVTHAMRSAST